MISNPKSKPLKAFFHNKELFSAKKIDKDQKIISRLVITDRYKILLPDYGNIEINLPPLHKSFYILMLRYPEGIRFKELSNFRNELIEIYKHVGNRSDIDQIKKSITELTDNRSNSVNEKCSRIKAAFLLHMEDAIAQNYYISGSRSQPKRIKLQSDLIQFYQKP
ncbi:hypothetical protein [Sediminibacterium sp. TEGAF015]|uniref:hypothetical protein n=1 Tax=Sediminibacterium sp. TEGAF015 TaxID=575378 RepID=UPI00220D7E32|nr:hypothetical protein [Sediminibacterium sp. TEGAF015]BDQ10786.1 hypothetical protein TEGAF0_00030 [Sediminibacterium sp. TEGAF015]